MGMNTEFIRVLSSGSGVTLLRSESKTLKNHQPSDWMFTLLSELVVVTVMTLKYSSSLS